MERLEIKSGTCIRCGRLLTDPVSVERCMGPICWKAARGGVFDAVLEADEREWAEREAFLRRGGEEDYGCNWSWPYRQGDVVVRLQARISVRYNAQNGHFEAYAFIHHPSEPFETVLYSGTDIRAAYRAAIETGPQMEAMAYRATRRTARGRVA